MYIKCTRVQYFKYSLHFYFSIFHIFHSNLNPPWCRFFCLGKNIMPVLHINCVGKKNNSVNASSYITIAITRVLGYLVSLQGLCSRSVRCRCDAADAGGRPGAVFEFVCRANLAVGSDGRVSKDFYYGVCVHIYIRSQKCCGGCRVRVA